MLKIMAARGSSAIRHLLGIAIYGQEQGTGTSSRPSRFASSIGSSSDGLSVKSMMILKESKVGIGIEHQTNILYRFVVGEEFLNGSG